LQLLYTNPEEKRIQEGREEGRSHWVSLSWINGMIVWFKDDSFSKENRMRNLGFLLFQDRLVSIC
jgi:hypothetical protein